MQAAAPHVWQKRDGVRWSQCALSTQAAMITCTGRSAEAGQTIQVVGSTALHVTPYSPASFHRKERPQNTLTSLSVTGAS